MPASFMSYQNRSMTSQARRQRRWLDFNIREKKKKIVLDSNSNISLIDPHDLKPGKFVLITERSSPQRRDGCRGEIPSEPENPQLKNYR